ncbi:MAG TPA: HD domain-containing phosphohydrolase [Blastocatellia bacterium]|nr:HD domain-containing phosphohydrolase [Blastocatellia bacterium]
MASKKDISILIVDDEEPIRRLLAMYLADDYCCVTAAGADEATALLAERTFNLVMTDITMPGTSGIELCQYVHKAFPETVVVMVSGLTDIHFAIEAMRHGAFDYVTKPFDLTQVLLAVDRALRYQALVAAKREYEHSLEETVRQRTNELRGLNENLNQMLESLYQNYRATLRALARALEARDVETAGHSDRVVAYSLRLGRELGLTHTELIALEQGALLHDIGKIGVRDSILLKPASLTDDEWVEMREHINHGLRIIGGIDFLKGAASVVGQHHEKYNGSGYPQGLSGEQIHINARIFAVADAFDAITSDRPYRAAASYLAARKEIIASVGTHFDPGVVNAFLAISESEWQEIRTTAESQDYIEHIIDKREIRSFIVSIKRGAGRTGALHFSALPA